MIQLTKKNLVEAMKGFRCIKIQHNNLDVIQCLRVRVTGNELLLTGTNLDETLTYHVPVEENPQPWESLVRYETLREVERHMDTATQVEFHPTLIRYYAGGVPMEVATAPESADSFPSDPVLTGSTETMDATSVQALLEAAAYASTDANRYLMTGVHISPHHVAATDGKRLYVCNSRKLAVAEKGLILPVRAAFKLWDSTAPLVFQTGKGSHKDEEPSLLVLRQDKWTYQTGILQGTFPDWQPILQSAVRRNQTVVEIAESDARRMVKALPCLPGSKESDTPVELSVSSTVPTVIARDREQESRLELPQSQCTGTEAAVSFNRHFLLQALQLGMRRLAIGDGTSPVLADDPTSMRKVLWMPLRLNRETKDGPGGDKQAGEPTGVPGNKAEPSVSDPPEAAPAHAPPSGEPAAPQPVPRSSETDKEADPLSSCAQLRDTLKQAVQAVGSLRSAIRQVSHENKQLQKDNRSLRRSIREVQKIQL